jgi:hypothetical protein
MGIVVMKHNTPYGHISGPIRGVLGISSIFPYFPQFR